MNFLQAFIGRESCAKTPRQALFINWLAKVSRCADHSRSLCRKLNGLADSLRFLVSRGVASNLDEVVAKLATMTAWPQLAAVVQSWVDGLPLPQRLPPATVGLARRLDRVDELASLARAWRNCLGVYRSAIDAGSCAVYLWQDPESTAACLVWRHGRLGWFLDEVKGPRNADIEPEQRPIIDTAFAELGILRSRVALTIDNMICGHANLLFSVEERQGVGQE